MNVSLALLNGKIYTMDGRVDEAVAISGDKVIKTGSNDEVKCLCDSKTEVIDLKGMAVLPGFNDSHLHFLGYGISINMVDLRGVQSIDEIIYRTRKYIDDNDIKPGEWVTGMGWDQNKLKEKRVPLAKDLDLISKVHPIKLDRICIHSAAANPLALKMCGIYSHTAVEGGTFEKDSDGNLTGYILENALTLINNRMPLPDSDKIAKIIERAQKDALKAGLTSLQTSDVEYTKSIDEVYEGYKKLQNDGKLDVRINEQVLLNNIDEVEKFIKSPYSKDRGNDFFGFGPVKIITDGSLGARSAALCSSYSDDAGNCGMLLYSREQLFQMVSAAHNAGYQVHLHCIGDAALKMCIDAIENAKAGKPSNMRHRVNHVQIGSTKLFRRMAQLGICADIQPSFVSSDWNMVEDRVGAERVKTSYAWKTMLDMGIHVAAGSDSPIENFSPLQGIYAAVTRKGFDGQPEGGWMNKEALSVKEAVELYTKGSAYASFDENKKGTITGGKLADIVVLSEDPFNIEKDAIKDIKVQMTIVGGKIKYVSK
jgi:predicted amidohydrolase YtcJ